MTLALYGVAALGVAVVVGYLVVVLLFWINERQTTYFDRIL